MRRLARRAEVPPWFGAETVLVCQPVTRRRVLSRFPRFSERQIFLDEIPTDDRDMSSLLRRIYAALDGPQRLELHAPGSDIAPAVWDPDVFTAGCTHAGGRVLGRSRRFVAQLPAHAAASCAS